MNRILLLIVAITTFSAFASGQPKTIMDYYLAMPTDYYAKDIEGNEIKGKAALTKFRKSLIKIEDIKNGYLRLEGTWEGWAEIALFKKNDGSYIIGHAESGCGPACEGFIKFYTYNAGKWAEITNSVFPQLTEAQIKQAFDDKNINAEEDGMSHYYLLPRQGTTVKMACNMCDDGTTSDENDTVLKEFVWNGEKFTMK
jgi:hypothetical protein